jgi:hypothetical protein
MMIVRSATVHIYQPALSVMDHSKLQAALITLPTTPTAPGTTDLSMTPPVPGAADPLATQTQPTRDLLTVTTKTEIPPGIS